MWPIAYQSLFIKKSYGPGIFYRRLSHNYANNATRGSQTYQTPFYHTRRPHLEYYYYNYVVQMKIILYAMHGTQWGTYK